MPAAAATVMAGLESRNSDDNGQTGEKPSPVTALGRADTAAGRWRGGKQAFLVVWGAPRKGHHLSHVASTQAIGVYKFL